MLRRGIGVCRKQAGKRKDKQTADQLYVVQKAIDASRRQLTSMQQSSTNTAQTVERLIKYPPSERLGRQIALSIDALQGKQPDLAAHGLQRMPNWIAGLQQAADNLPANEIEKHVAALNARRLEMQGNSDKLANDFAAARQELAAAPLTPAGMRTLDHLQSLAWLKQLLPQDQDAFRNDINNKRQQYSQLQRRKQMAQQPQSQPARSAGGASGSAASTTTDLPTYFREVLVGGAVEDVSIRGLTPAVPAQQAVRHATKTWGLRETVSLALSPAYGLHGLMVEFKSMDDDTVGQIDYTTRFKSALDLNAAVDSLSKRFGNPDKTEDVPAGKRLTWRDGDRILQVIVANRVNHMYRGYQSRLGVALWSERYEDYLADINEKCAELSDTPMNELSLSQKQYMAGHCSLMGKTDKHAGLAAAL
jgi:hypothetical protein